MAGDARQSDAAVSDGDGPSAGRLTLTDFLDIRTLQDLQDGFAALTQLTTTIRDADGQLLTVPTDTSTRLQSDQLLDLLLTDEDTDAASGLLVAPIVVDGQELGRIEIADRAADAAPLPTGALRAAAVQFLYLLANHITRLCYQEYQLRQRVEQLDGLNRLSSVLSGPRELPEKLSRAAAAAAELLRVKAAVIRLLDGDGLSAASGVSPQFVQQTPFWPQRSATVAQALAGQPAAVQNVRSDPWLISAGQAEQEGIGSALCVGMIVQDRPLGVLQLFDGDGRQFHRADMDLAQAIAQLLVGAVGNARHDEAQAETLRVQRQLRLAGEVQQRMLPSRPPKLEPFDIAARYVPSLELAGDFYDLLDLQGNVGIAVADVVGKGIGAGLMMASLRAAIRAYAQDVYDLDEILRRVNVAMVRETTDSEFATLFYGVLDPRRLRLTYCNAGHDPPLLLRDGKTRVLDVGGMVVGVDPAQRYQKGIVNLRPGDLLVLYTDGLIDAVAASGEKFGRDRLRDAVIAASGLSANEVANALLWQMRRFIGLRRNTDDTTLVTVKVGQAH